MTRISLTDFTGVMTVTATQRMTAVKKIKNRPAYSPALDFYKPLRQDLIAIHQKNGVRGDVLKLPPPQDPKKVHAYSVMCKAYSRWWGQKKMVGMPSYRSVVVHQGMELSINPEVWVQMNGQPYAIKLAFSKDSSDWTKRDAEVVLAAMEAGLQGVAPQGTELALLVIRKRKMFTLSQASTPAAIRPALVQAELAYIDAMWAAV